MTVNLTRRIVARPDSRRRFTIPGADVSKDYAIDALPDGSYLISPCTIRTEFEQWLDARVDNAAELMHSSGEDWGQLDEETDRLALQQAEERV